MHTTAPLAVCYDADNNDDDHDDNAPHHHLATVVLLIVHCKAPACSPEDAPDLDTAADGYAAWIQIQTLASSSGWHQIQEEYSLAHLVLAAYDSYPAHP